MKKILMILGIMLLAMSFVLAEGPATTQTGMTTQTQTQLQTQEHVFQNQVKGLENAQIRVRNNETAEHLERVMNKIQEKKREQLAKLEGLEVSEDDEGKVVAKGKVEGKFLGLFKMQRTLRYEISEDGNTERKKNMFEFLWSTLEEEKIGGN